MSYTPFDPIGGTFCAPQGIPLPLGPRTFPTTYAHHLYATFWFGTQLMAAITCAESTIMIATSTLWMPRCRRVPAPTTHVVCMLQPATTFSSLIPIKPLYWAGLCNFALRTAAKTVVAVGWWSWRSCSTMGVLAKSSRRSFGLNRAIVLIPQSATFASGLSCVKPLIWGGLHCQRFCLANVA